MFLLFGPGHEFIQNITDVTELHMFRQYFVAFHKLNLRVNCINSMERIPVVQNLNYAPREFRARLFKPFSIRYNSCEICYFLPKTVMLLHSLKTKRFVPRS